MGFTEITFLFIFLPAAIIIYLLAEKIFRNDTVNNVVLVICSFLFYWWAGKESFILFLALGLFVYFAGCSIDPDKKTRRKIALPVILLVGLLAFFKYIALIKSWINTLGDFGIIRIGTVIAPIGISFVVFEAISYLVDVYRGDAKTGTLLECFTFLSLFPKLVSGPIVLWKDFQSQLQNRRSSIEQVAVGIDRIIIGYAKKVIIADTFAAQISSINSGIAASGVDMQTMWLRALLYFFQIYFDFSGYSDIAIGLCNIFGFKIKENFRYPYLSETISEFWRRWHISLGSWFREYVYIPLGGNRKGNVYLHLLIVFLLTGIWHGTGIQLWIWGGIHGLLMITERAVHNKNWYKKIPGIIKWFCTTAMVFLAWIFFMSKDLASACQSICYMFIPMTTETINFTWRFYFGRRIMLLLFIAVIGQLTGIESIHNYIEKTSSTSIGSLIKRIILLLLFVVDILYVVNSTYSPFIYFQF